LPARRNADAEIRQAFVPRAWDAHLLGAIFGRELSDEMEVFRRFFGAEEFGGRVEGLAFVFAGLDPNASSISVTTETAMSVFPAARAMSVSICRTFRRCRSAVISTLESRISLMRGGSSGSRWLSIAPSERLYASATTFSLCPIDC
jgi:hypothetical protein